MMCGEVRRFKEQGKSFWLVINRRGNKTTHLQPKNSHGLKHSKDVFLVAMTGDSAIGVTSIVMKHMGICLLDVALAS